MNKKKIVIGIIVVIVVIALIFLGVMVMNNNEKCLFKYLTKIYNIHIIKWGELYV